MSHTHTVTLSVTVTMTEMDNEDPESSAEIALEIVTDLIHNEWDADAIVEVTSFS